MKCWWSKRRSPLLVNKQHPSNKKHLGEQQSSHQGQPEEDLLLDAVPGEDVSYHEQEDARPRDMKVFKFVFQHPFLFVAILFAMMATLPVIKTLWSIIIPTNSMTNPPLCFMSYPIGGDVKDELTPLSIWCDKMKEHPACSLGGTCSNGKLHYCDALYHFVSNDG